MLVCSLESNDLTTLEWKYRKLSVTIDELVICIYRRPMNFLFLKLSFKYLLRYYRKCTLKKVTCFVIAFGCTKKNDMNRWIDKVWIDQEYLHVVVVERYRNIPTTPISNNVYSLLNLFLPNLFFAVISLVLAGILNVLKRSRSWNRVRTFVIVDRVYRFSFHNSLTILPVTYIYMKSFFISTYKI